MNFREFKDDLLRKIGATFGIPPHIVNAPPMYLIWNRPKASWLGPVESDGGISLVRDRDAAGRYTSEQCGGILSGGGGNDEVIVRDTSADVQRMFLDHELVALRNRMEHHHEESLASEKRSGPSPYYTEPSLTPGRSPLSLMKERDKKYPPDE